MDSKVTNRLHSKWVQCRKLLAAEEGVETVEWVGMTLVLVTLLAAVSIFIASGDSQIGQAVLDTFECNIRATSSGGCGGAAGAPGSASIDAPTLTTPSLGVPLLIAEAVLPPEINPEANSQDSPGILGQIGGFFWGIGEGAVDTVVGIATLARDGLALSPITGDIYGLIDPEGRAEIQGRYQALLEAFVNDPLGTGGQMLQAIIEPVTTDWREGRYGEAIGRVVFEIGMIFVPGDEVGKAGALGRLDAMLPDELASVLARAEQLTPDEMAQLMNRLDNLTPDEASQLIEAINRLPPDEARRLERLLGCSFTADTLVHTATGPVAISQLSLGTPVWAIDEHSGRFGYYPVIAIWSHEDDNLLDLTISGETINTTSDHPFLTADGQWVTAGDLTIGQSVQGSFAAGVVEEAVALDASQTMFNITVSQANTYAVGDGGWVVHNTCTIEELRNGQRAVQGTSTVATREGPNGTLEEVTPQELRHPLPNSRYSVNGYYYETDEFGRVIEASGDLRLETAPRNTGQQVEVGHEGVPRPNGNEYGVTDDGGHLIGSRFGGAGEAINMLPQNSALNRNGRWKQLENFWAERINAGETVHVEISPIYNGRGNRPTSYDVVYRVNNGDPITVNIPNNRTGTGGSGGVPGN